MNALVLIEHLKSFSVVAFAATFIAGYVNIGEEVHFDFDQAVALTGLATPALDVETEASGLVASGSSLRCCGKQFTDRSKDIGIGRWV